MEAGVRVIVIVPAWDEAPRIARVLQGVPSWVDAVIVVDDASTDGTAEVARAFGDPRVAVLVHTRNRGVGASLVTGYRHAMSVLGGAGASPRDVFAVMAGDGQMDPADLAAVVAPIVLGDADYVKGNRFGAPGITTTMPAGRLLGGLVFSLATSLAVGVSITDSQCGYTALARGACEKLDLGALWPRYGYPNDLLSQLALRRLRIAEVPVRPVYADEVSRLATRHVPIVAGLIARALARRLAGRCGLRVAPVSASAERAFEDRGHVRQGVIEIE